MRGEVLSTGIERTDDESVIKMLVSRETLPGENALVAELGIGKLRAKRVLKAAREQRGPDQSGPVRKPGPVRKTGPVRTSKTQERGKRGQTVLFGVAGMLATIVVIAPVSLSAQDLFRWARSHEGLGLDGPWPYVVFVGLDAAAGLCICLTFISALRRETSGMAHLLVWVFAGMSAYANYNNGIRLVPTGTKDAWWFFPAMSVAGALLLEIVVKRVRQWSKANAGETERSTATFRFMRWVVAPNETRRAWIASIKEGIAEPRLAIEHVRAESAKDQADKGRVVDNMRVPDERWRKLLSGTRNRPMVR